MTVVNTNVEAPPVVVVNGVTSYPFNGIALADPTHMQVTVVTSAGEETALVYGVDFTVSYDALSEGGVVNTSVASAALHAGSTLVRRRVTPNLQDVDLPEQGPFFASAIEKALDRQTLVMQEQDAQADTLALALQQNQDDLNAVSSGLPSSGYADLVAEVGVLSGLRLTAGKTAEPSQVLTHPTTGVQWVSYEGSVIPNDLGDASLIAAGFSIKRSNGRDVREFGLIPNTGADMSAEMQAARDWAAAQPLGEGNLYIPPGEYITSVSPNWGIKGLEIEMPGVTITNTGTGPSFIVDGGTAGFVYDFKILGWPIIRGGPTTGGGLFIRSCHRSHIQIRCTGCGTSETAVEIQFCVLTQFDKLVVTNNAGGWYLGGKPALGMLVTRRNEVPFIEDAGYVQLHNPIIEGTQDGLLVDHSVGLQIFGGAIEGITDTAWKDTANNRLCRVYGCDFEANGILDIDVYGSGNEFHGCDSEKLSRVNASAERNSFFGGQFDEFEIIAGGQDTYLNGIVYDRFFIGSTIIDNGTRTCMRDVLDRQAPSIRHNSLLTQTVITPASSPYTYTNTTGNDVRLNIVDGVMDFVGFQRAGVANSVGDNNGQITLSPTDALILVYTVTPTIVELPS